MYFNTFTFFTFLLIVYLSYLFIFSKDIKFRNLFLLIVSYIFYGWWDYRFLTLIIFSSAMSYGCGLLINDYNQKEEHSKAKTVLTTNIIVNLGLLAYFKYTNFFVESVSTLLNTIGIETNWTTINIILPVGISFYTFQALSYTIDVYRKNISATKDILSYFTYIAFFPQLVAGPIERATNMLPQFAQKFEFNYDKAKNGLLLIAVGLVKKMVIADRLAIYVDNVWNNLHDASGISLLIGLIFFAFQLYLDFSAYSQIAIGVARLFGFELMQNFNMPYLSTSFIDFWKRWHISLTSWFRDYLYIPLGGNRKGTLRTYANTIIVFTMSGLWHGASWTFVLWGFLNGFFLIINKLSKWSPSNLATKAIGILLSFSVWTLTLAFFRSQTMNDALYVISELSLTGFESLYNHGLNSMEFSFATKTIIVLMIIELLITLKNEWFYKIINLWPIRWSIYIFLTLIIIYCGIYGSGSDSSFIYFQF